MFLLLFSYVILCDFRSVENGEAINRNFNLVISVPEIVLIIWVITFGLDEFRQVVLCFWLWWFIKLDYFNFFCCFSLKWTSAKWCRLDFRIFLPTFGTWLIFVRCVFTLLDWCSGLYPTRDVFWLQGNFYLSFLLIFLGLEN